MVEKINNFNNKYNITINVSNNILYLNIINHTYNTKFNLIFNSTDLKLIDINNINILYICLLKCFNKVNNYNIYFYEQSTELILEIDYIDEIEYIEKYFKLYLTYYNDYYEKLMEEYDKQDLLKNNDTGSNINRNYDIFKYNIHNYEITNTNNTDITNTNNTDITNITNTNIKYTNITNNDNTYMNNDDINNTVMMNTNNDDIDNNDDTYLSYMCNYFKDIVFLLKILCIDYDDAI